MTATEASLDSTASEVPTMHGGLANLDVEHQYWIDEVIGTVPNDLGGTFYRNGPGRQRVGDMPYGHWFDGCGMLSAFSFVDGRVHFTNKYVRTPKYLEETAAQAIRYRGFGTQIPGGVRKNIGRWTGNPSNTNVVHHAGKLLTLYEGGRPFELDPATLDTIGEHSFDGKLTKRAMISAHGHRHHRTGSWINFGPGSAGMSRRGPKMCFNIFDVDTRGSIVRTAQIPVDGVPFSHDFALSDRYAVFFVNSITMGSIAPVALGMRTISDGMAYDGDLPMQIVVVDLDTLTEVCRTETGPGAIVHFGNAFEVGDEVIIDAMYADNFEANKALSDMFNADRLRGGEFRRYRVNVATGAVEHDVLSPTNSEFPTFNLAKAGRRHDHTYTAVSVENGHDSFFNGIQRVSTDGEVQLNTLPPGLFGSEPVFAPATGSQRDADGYVLEVVYDAHEHRSSLVIFRAMDICEPIATLKLEHHLPHQFHGYWHDEVNLKLALDGPDS